MEQHRSMEEEKAATLQEMPWYRGIAKLLDRLVSRLKRRELVNSGGIAYETAEIMRQVVARGKYTTVQELLDTMKITGKKITQAQPMEIAIGSIVRRSLYIVRQECAAYSKVMNKKDEDEEKISDVDLSVSLHTLLDDRNQNEFMNWREMEFQDKVRAHIIEVITELMDEVKTVYQHIAEQAVEHIYANEVILTFGISKTVLHFLQGAAKFRSFEVIVAESGPEYKGQDMAMQLAKSGINTTVITDSAVFAMMKHVNKVIIGTHAVMANGGLLAHTGAHNIAVAAKYHSVSVVCVCALHKLCPLYSFDQDTFNEHKNPCEILNYDNDEFVAKVDVMNPGFDYIPPDLVTLLITNFGGHSPTYIYRLLAEYYNPEDYEL